MADSTNGMDALLSEYMEEEQQLYLDENIMFDPNATATAATAAAENELENYYAKTQEYYKTMSYMTYFPHFILHYIRVIFALRNM